MPPKKNKGKNRHDDSDDDDGADPLAIMKKLAGEDVSTTSTSANKGKDSNSKQASRPNATNTSGGVKKGGKNKGNISDDEDEEDSKPKPSTTAPATPNTNNTKQSKKKDKKKGKGKFDDSDDDSDGEDPIAKLAKANKAVDKEDEDEEEEEDETPRHNNKGNKFQPAPASNPIPSSNTNTNTNAAKKGNKKDKKKGKGKQFDSDDDSDNQDPIAKLAQANKAHAQSSTINDAEDNDDDDDGDEDEAEEVRQPVKPAATTTPVGNKVSKKDKKKHKNKGGNVHSNDESDDDDGDYIGNLANKNASAKDDDDEEEEEEEVAEKISTLNLDSNDKKSAASTPAAPVSTTATDTATASVSTRAATPTRVPIPTTPVTESPTPTVTTTTTTPVSVPSLPPTTSSVPVVKPTESKSTPNKTTTATTTAPTIAPSAAPAPKKVKTKLELRLEEAKRKKEEEVAAAAKIAAEQAKIDAEKQAILLEQQRIEKIEADTKAVEELASKALAAETDDDDDDNEEDDNDDEEDDTGDKPSDLPKQPLTAEEIEKEMRMRATMYGDEVFSEYGHTGDGSVDGTTDDSLSTLKSKKDGKLSNKAKRKLAKEIEAKEREAESNAIALQRSIEGAQFAVSQSIVDPNDQMWQNALDIIIPSVSISAHNKELFVNTELNIVHGRRYGLVGPNGAGKSTLLKMIACGELKIPPRIDYLYVEQEVVADDTAAVDAVLKADKVRWALVQEEKQLLKDLEIKPDDAKDSRLGEVYEQLALINAASAESRARRILFGLGFDVEMQARSTKYFSGGWRMRISLARALFMEPTLLMLDEPTNHLDLNAVIWLDDYLQRWKKTLLIVSHDQDFLNSVCEEIIHLDEKKLFVYRGNYDTFKEQEHLKRIQQEKAWDKQEKRLRELKLKGVSKSNAEKEQLKLKGREPGARSKKQEAAAQAGGLESGENQVELIKRPREYKVEFGFPDIATINPPMLEVRDVNFRYGPNLPWLFKGLNFGIDMTSRICIVGPNGSGKSTIIKLITDEVNPPEGEVRRNPRMRVGVYNQHFVDRLPMEEDPISYLRRLFNEQTYQSTRNILGKYGLEGHAHTIPIRDLSGGQKARVVMVELSLMAPHLLFLDEPTNNLDIESIDALCDALKLFNGGVVLVSHDARLIESIECQLWVVEDRNVTPWTAGFKDYRQRLLQQLEEQLAAIMPGSGERPKDKDTK